jgi:protein ImuB
MNVAVVKALAPTTLVGEFNPVRDFKSLRQVALVFQALSPFVALDAKLTQAYRKKETHMLDERWSGFTIDLTGTERVHRSEKRVALQVLRYFSKRGIPVRVGLGNTVSAAWARARYGANTLGRGYEEQGALADDSIALGELPLAALRLDEGAIYKLHDVGVTTIQGLLDLPRGDVGERYGAFVLQALDRLSGATAEPLVWLKARQPCKVRQHFEVPLFSHAAVQEVLLQVFQQVLQQLQRRRLKARTFRISCSYYKEDRSTAVVTKDLSLFSSGADERRLRSVIVPTVEGLKVNGDVHTIEVEAATTSRVLPRQGGVFPSDDAAEYQDAIDDLMNNLVVHLGHSSITRAKFHESYIPERAFTYEPITAGGASGFIGAVGPVVAGPTVADSTPAYGKAILPLHRPSILFRKPQPVRVMALLPDHPPSMIIWNGDPLRVLNGFGPERIGNEWWDTVLSSDAVTSRDYFRIQDSVGRWLWIYRQQETLEWFVQGMWG